jgi:hypothetical protein
MTRSTLSLFRTQAAGFGLGLAMLASPALADSIAPSSYSNTLAVGESVTITKTVTITEGRPVDALADVFFLSDTTGSMGGVIGSVQANATTILNNTALLGNVNWGVGQYKDIGDVFVSQIDQTMTASQLSVQTAINSWVASGGGDLPEAGFNGLIDAANNGGWRTGSSRFLVWFGDATLKDGGLYPTQADAIAALNAQNITVIAVDSGNLDGLGQATAVVNATGGSLHDISSNPGSSIATTIVDAIGEAFDTYTTVALDPDNPAGVGVSFAPLSYVGSFDRSIERTFTFSLTFTGLAPGDYTFNTHALLDGGIVASELDHIIVTDGEVPLPGAAWLMLSGLVGLGAMARRRRKQAS